MRSVWLEFLVSLIVSISLQSSRFHFTNNMKLLSSSCACILVLGIFVTQLHGYAVNKDEPLKFLVLQRSDILQDGVETNTEVNQPDVSATEADDIVDVTTEAVEYVTENIVVDASPSAVSQEVETVVEKKIFNPVDAWKELGFLEFPEDDIVPVNVSEVAPPAPAVKIPSGNITRGNIGRANCQCGRPRARIVNGEPARINDIPWTAALVRNGFFGFGASKKPYCGGTLINDLYVLTASHCVDGMFANGIKVWLNEEDFLIDTESSGQRLEFGIDKIIMHGDYSRRTVDNDIALLKLSKPAPIDLTTYPSAFVTPACLPANNEHDFSNHTGTVAGWGLTTEGGSQSNVLRKVDVPIMTNEKCNSSETKYEKRITENMLCAGFDEGGKDACQGDSGGPFIIDNSGRKTLVGVVSWGFGCAKPQAPGVYTRVARYAAWILDNTEGANWCEQ